MTTRSTLTELAETLRAAGVGVFVYEGAERRQRWLTGAEHFNAAGVDSESYAAEAAGGYVETKLLRLDHDAEGAPRFLGLMHPADGDAPAVARISGRSALQAHLTQLAETLKPEALVACCVFGIDGMREFSRCYGFESGDSLACAVGERLSRMLPASAALARIGGAKFAAAVIGDDATAVRVRATAIAAEFSALSFDVGFGSISVTLSIGAAVARAPALATPEPFEAALAALDEAAGEHDGGVFVADGAVDAADMTPAAMRAGARTVMRALESESVAIAFQPVVTAHPPHNVAFRECLARLRDPAGKWVSAGQFLPKIERLDLVSTLDRRILRLAVQTLAQHPTERLSVNVSTRTMRDRAWLRDLRAAAEEHPGAVERLIVELTESSAVTDAERTRRFLDSVRALGCAIALDDFGAGYSSFRHVRDFRPDWVKIDGGFVRGVATDPDNMLFVDTLVGIARNFEMATVAEFVETDADAATLLSLGVDCLQGYRFGAPEMEPIWSDPRLKLVR